MTLTCQSVTGLIRAAYILFPTGAPRRPLDRPRIPVEGGPEWISSALYTIAAKAEDKASPEFMQGPLLQTLLENRFKLKVHRETREIPVYDLIVAKNGPKLRPFQEGSCTPTPEIDLARGPVPWPALPPGRHYCFMAGGANGANMQIRAEGITIADFARVFLFPDGRPVVDKTNISGKYDIQLTFGLDDEGLRRMLEITGTDPGQPTNPSFFNAIQEQLGLRVQPAKGQGEFLVIDHVERPDEN